MFPLLAAAMPSSSAAGAVDAGTMALGIVAGLALFLYGVQRLSEALQAAAGGRFERLLAKTTGNRFAALAVGIIATILLDSSSVTIVLVITLVESRLLKLSGALPAILGANIGTTFSSQVFAWNVDEWSPLLLAAGVLLALVAPAKSRWTTAGAILLGIGLVLFALHVIGDAVAPIAESPAMLDWFERLATPWLGALAGAGGTVAIQSSSAMMGIVIKLAKAGAMTLPAGVAVMLGAEIGTCADTLVATVGRSRAAVKAGLFHLGFNMVSVGVGLIAIVPLTLLAQASADAVGQQVANAHVAFNVIAALAVLPFVAATARLLDHLLPDRTEDAPA